ncbi:MAG TPA: RNA methyltransferase [Candidatus Binataceae bacterium]|nr:RNA methyltransferase [Candidatus Binataceae bacterium]
MADLFVALIHYPVVDRTGKIVSSMITSLDLHDIARSSRTYGVRAFFVVHPLPEQREFAAKVMDHWRLDPGRLYDTRRREALDLVEVVEDLDSAIKGAEALSRVRPRLAFTSARLEQGMSYAALREEVNRPDAAPVMLMLGTGFGMAPAMRDRADIELAPINGPGAYNHLSVRAAASIMLDRLRGR